MKDLIIDCFAGGGGASVGIEMALGRDVDIAINHDPQAILMHRTNHPNTLHLTEDIFKVDLQKYVGNNHVSLMWASPDCTSHSKAKGGKPRNQGLRILPWAVFKHAKAILPDVIIMENVEEIQQWGPLDEEGHPIKERMGEDYKKFITAMTLLGYVFESKELVAADYGAPTTRKRWYAVFRRDSKPIVWPKPTHSKNGENGLPKWKPVADILDFSNLGKSIFGREKPLAEKTMNRIARGLDKFVFNGGDDAYIVQIGYGEKAGQKPRVNSVNKPLGTIVAQSCKHALATPHIVQYTPEHGSKANDRSGMVAAFISKFYKTGCGQGCLEPLHTITTSAGHFGQVNVLMADWEKLKEAGIDEETAQKCTWVSEFIVEYYGTGTGQPCTEPLHTVVTKDRFALITVLGNEYVILDIYLRMLTAEELKLAQGFPRDYIINRDYRWNKYPASEQVRRIGNSVVPVMAKALVEANCGYLKTGERAPIPMVFEQASGQLSFG